MRDFVEMMFSHWQHQNSIASEVLTLYLFHQLLGKDGSMMEALLGRWKQQPGLSRNECALSLFM
jgi:hypothetical protein